MMKQKQIKCPYCHANASLRPASVVYGLNRRSQEISLSLRPLPACDAYVSAHDRTHRPMGTWQMEISGTSVSWRTGHWSSCGKAGTWKNGRSTSGSRQSTLDRVLTHIGQFSEWMCDEVVRLCRQASAPPAAGQAAA